MRAMPRQGPDSRSVPDVPWPGPGVAELAALKRLVTGSGQAALTLREGAARGERQFMNLFVRW